MRLDQHRIDYAGEPLDPDALGAEPMPALRRWLEHAHAAGVPEPNAMSLATADADGRPSLRMVLLKEAATEGAVFYTNHRSRKGRELAVNPWAAACLYWHPVHRQVRLEGPTERLPDADADAYFRTRPRGSQLAAWASHQSEPEANRAALEARVAEVGRRYPGEVPRPPHWGGYRLRPRAVEFWQGRPDRLHDRVIYRWRDDRWQVERLDP